MTTSRRGWLLLRLTRGLEHVADGGLDFAKFGPLNFLATADSRSTTKRKEDFDLVAVSFFLGDFGLVEQGLKRVWVSVLHGLAPVKVCDFVWFKVTLVVHTKQAGNRHLPKVSR